MGFKCGIIGLPNVGKSTIFNALTKTTIAQAANYPFCTIEPNAGNVVVPDSRMKKIATIAGSKKVVPTQISFIDIAGLVRGASRGEGLGNKFLANIHEVDAIIHVLRCFESENITHVEGRVDPALDAETVETELILADLEILERCIMRVRKRVSAKDKEASITLPIMEKALEFLKNGKPVRLLSDVIPAKELSVLSSLNLLTLKPILYVCNVEEDNAATGNEYTDAVSAILNERKTEIIIVSAAMEAEIAHLPSDEVEGYLEAMGLREDGLRQLIRAGYHLLDLITYFTCGLKESRAWTIKRGIKAPQAAGVIHSDFERGFIRAQTIAYNDYVSLGGETAAKEAGKARDEGKEYVVQDGDIMLFKYNV